MQRVVFIMAVLFLFCGIAFGDTFTERWYLAAGSVDDYIDRGPGEDRLPYTSDDEDLPTDGNAGGAWSFCFLDIDGDGDDDHTFSMVRRNDDDMFTLSTWSDFSHGVIAEGEMWVDLKHALNLGAGGDDPIDDDFEWNDGPGWDGESNWFWYNNLRADQRGLGGSRYYLEYRDPVTWFDESFDEVQQWTWNIRFKNNSDDGTGIEGNWGAASGLVVKGLFIPVTAIPELVTGDLDPLFGWQDFDMADYVRDTLYPKLDDESLSIFLNFEGSNGCDTASAMPPTYVMILQAEATIFVTDFVKAEYWGISDDQTATFRSSAILLKGDDAMNPPIDLEPEDGRLLNLWCRDNFVRKNVSNWGRLEMGTTDCPDSCWNFIGDDIEDCQADYALMLPAESGPENTYVALPIGRELDGMDGALVARVSVALENPETEGNRVELILSEDDSPVAWVSLKSGAAPQLGVGGGSLEDNSGCVQDPLEQDVAPEPEDLAVMGDGYTEMELIFSPGTKHVELRLDGGTIHSFTYTAGVKSLVNRISFYAEADGEETGVTIDDLSLYQAFSLDDTQGSVFRRGDANADGAVNIADAITVLTYLFGGGVLDCLDAADGNDDGQLNIADAISVLGYLFGGASPPPDPGPTTCGVDPTEDPDGDLGCETYTTCQ